MRLSVARNVWADGPEHLTEFHVARCDAVTTNLSLSSNRGSEAAESLNCEGFEVGNGRWFGKCGLTSGRRGGNEDPLDGCHHL